MFVGHRGRAGAARGLRGLGDRRRAGVDRVLAIDHVDPFTDVPVLARGIVGDVDGEPVVASPLHKQRFSLLDGRCLDDPDIRLSTFVTRIEGGVVLVARP